MHNPRSSEHTDSSACRLAGDSVNIFFDPARSRLSIIPYRDSAMNIDMDTAVRSLRNRINEDSDNKEALQRYMALDAVAGKWRSRVLLINLRGVIKDGKVTVNTFQGHILLSRIK